MPSDPSDQTVDLTMRASRTESAVRLRALENIEADVEKIYYHEGRTAPILNSESSASLTVCIHKFASGGVLWKRSMLFGQPLRVLL